MKGRPDVSGAFPVTLEWTAAMTDRDYFRQRAEQERARAAACDQSRVRGVHLELAALYTAKLRECEQPLLRAVG